MPNFHVDKTDAHTFARLGKIHLKNGVLQTPAFMPVGTHGTVRGIAAPDLEATGAELMLANTYHLFVKPGVDLIHKVGGLHAFSTWKKPILTDSGGYQVFSLADKRKITEEGVTFKNPRNGDRIFLNPEIVVDTQEKFGSDIMMVLDECPPPTATPEQVNWAVARTTRWAARSRAARTRRDLALFPIVQGGSHEALRQKSLSELLALEEGKDPWEGIAVGGMSVGEEKNKFIETLYQLRGQLPGDRPHYLMGVGTPRDLVFAVACGIDMFDCVLPSRNGRHGIVMTRQGKMNLFNAQFTEDKDPIDPHCQCTTCQRYSRAFLRHLFMIDDTLSGRLATIHNIQYFLDLMTTIRARIEEGTFLQFALEFIRNRDHIFLGFEKSAERYPEVFV